jgi:hypothetical protein
LRTWDGTQRINMSSRNKERNEVRNKYQCGAKMELIGLRD